MEPEETEWLPRMKREEVEVEEVEITSVGIASRLVLVLIVKKKTFLTFYSVHRKDTLPVTVPSPRDAGGARRKVTGSLIVRSRRSATTAVKKVTRLVIYFQFC